MVTDATQACVYIVMAPESSNSLESLDNWGGDGRNQALVFTNQTGEEAGVNAAGHEAEGDH